MFVSHVIEKMELECKPSYGCTTNNHLLHSASEANKKCFTDKYPFVNIKYIILLVLVYQCTNIKSVLYDTHLFLFLGLM